MHSEVISAAFKLYPITSFKNIINGFRFFKKAIQHSEVLDGFISKINKSGQKDLFRDEFVVLGTLRWPYIHNLWPVHKRFEIIATHYELIKTQPDIFNIKEANQYQLLDLNAYSSGLTAVIDKAKWFRREGEIVVNLFKNDYRVSSIAFSLGDDNGDLVIYVGAIQCVARAINIDSLEILKIITKDLEGLRPKSLIIELLKIIADGMQVKHIYAISNKHRHHFHPFFKNYAGSQLVSNYDTIWEEHGGVLSKNGFYELPLDKARKDFADIASNKRAMYRRRYEMLDEIEQQLKKLFL